MREAIRRVYKHTPFSYGTIIPPEYAKGAGLDKGSDVRLLWGDRGILVILPIGMQLTPEERKRLEEILDGGERQAPPLPLEKDKIIKLARESLNRWFSTF